MKAPIVQMLSRALCTTVAAVTLNLVPQAGWVQTSERPTMQQAERAWAAGDYVTARASLERLAEETSIALAQYRYGRILVEGRGGPRDVVGAVFWLEQAVAQDHTEAATLLARILLSVTPPDRDRAHALLAKAAAANDAEAQLILGGLLIASDPEAGFDWILAAAKQGRVDAQFEAARSFLTGRGTDADPVQAQQWMTRAAAGGHTEAQFALAQALDRTDAQAALDWYLRAAETGLPIAQRILGTRFLTGHGVEQNAAEAERWLTSAARAGDPGAMLNLSTAYLDGSVLVQDDGKAFRWASQAADADLPRGIFQLATLFETGRGTKPDFERALDLYKRAAASNDAQAQARLAAFLIGGGSEAYLAPSRAVPWVVNALEAGDKGALDWLVTQAERGLRRAQTELGFYLLDEAQDQATDWLSKAASAGDVRAQAFLGHALVTGEHGLDPDYVAAHAWLNVAAASGDPEALQTREVISALMTPEQVAAAQDQAREIFSQIDAAVPRQPTR